MHAGYELGGQHLWIPIGGQLAGLLRIGDILGTRSAIRPIRPALAVTTSASPAGPLKAIGAKSSVHRKSIQSAIRRCSRLARLGAS